jgi:hypothetical protein
MVAAALSVPPKLVSGSGTVRRTWAVEGQSRAALINHPPCSRDRPRLGPLRNVPENRLRPSTMLRMATLPEASSGRFKKDPVCPF